MREITYFEVSEDDRIKAAVDLMQAEYPHRQWSTLSEDAKESWLEMVDIVIKSFGLKPEWESLENIKVISRA